MDMTLQQAAVEAGEAEAEKQAALQQAVSQAAAEKQAACWEQAAARAAQCAYAAVMDESAWKGKMKAACAARKAAQADDDARTWADTAQCLPTPPPSPGRGDGWLHYFEEVAERDKQAAEQQALKPAAQVAFAAVSKSILNDASSSTAP